jgi:dienelactone hydrolase
VKGYLEVEEEWQFLGKSPIKDIRISPGFKRWKIEKEGYKNLRLAFDPDSLLRPPGPIQIKLSKKETIPDGMVPVPDLNLPKLVQEMMMAGVDPIGDILLGNFLIDRFETTNKQFKEFLDSGGYQKREYWKYEFIKDGRTLSWDEAMQEFWDATGRPGPVEWEMGSYPDGEDDYPVRGVSWYEASAYAEFTGKSLPTIYHWYGAAGTFESSSIASLSNFKNTGPAIVGSHSALNTFGSHDMAGNVREWCWNESRGLRYILGGAWSDPVYLFFHPLARSPFDRSPSNGFRCVRYLDPEGAPQSAARPVELVLRDYFQETPVDDSVFRVFKQQFSYDPSELNTHVEWTDDSQEYWREEKITFDAAYDGDRMIAYLFLPKAASPPYQTIIAFPGSSAIRTDSSKSGFRYINWIMQSGRAAVLPIYKGTYERRDGLASTWPNRSHRYTDYVIKWIKDLRRSIDYLETRSDIDIDRLAYLGISWGGRMGAIIPAVEPRIKVSVLYLGGLASGRALAEVDQINYITRVTIPVLMLNGKYDSIEPFETAQKPMLQLLGTSEEHKHHIVYETDHGIPRNAGIRDSLEWLDRYLGPVKMKDGNGK